MNNEILILYNKHKNTEYNAMCEYYSNLTKELDAAIITGYTGGFRH